MTHTPSSSRKRDSAETADPSPNRAGGGTVAGSTVKDQRTNREWPGKSEPGHIRPIGPAHRPGSPQTPEGNSSSEDR